MVIRHSNIYQPDPTKPQPGQWDKDHVDERGNQPPGWAYDVNGKIVGLVDGGGIPFLRGAVLSGEWMTPPSIFRLRLTGTGTVVMDARDSLGVETLAVESFTVSAATDQIEFPYAGDNAVAIRVTLTGDVTCEVI